MGVLSQLWPNPGRPEIVVHEAWPLLCRHLAGQIRVSGFRSASVRCCWSVQRRGVQVARGRSRSAACRLPGRLTKTRNQRHRCLTIPICAQNRPLHSAPCDRSPACSPTCDWPDGAGGPGNCVGIPARFQRNPGVSWRPYSLAIGGPLGPCRRRSNVTSAASALREARRRCTGLVGDIKAAPSQTLDLVAEP